LSYKQLVEPRPRRASKTRGTRLVISVLGAAGLAAGGFAGAYALASTIRSAGSSWTGGTIVDLDLHPTPVVHAPRREQTLPSLRPDVVEVPSLVGMSYGAAAAKLASLRFVVRRTSVDSKRPAGIVVTVEPAPGTTRPVGAAITLGVSNGSFVAVPRVVGVTRAEAIQRLAAARLRASVLYVNTSVRAQDDVVLAQRPAAGVAAAHSSIVVITLGHFSRPTPAPSPAPAPSPPPPASTAPPASPPSPPPVSPPPVSPPPPPPRPTSTTYYG
jgi:PASTA domain